MRGNSARPRVFEEIGFGYRGAPRPGVRVGGHITASALAFQLEDIGYAPHPLFVGIGPDVDLHGILDVSLTAGPLLDLTGEALVAGAGMLSVQAPIGDWLGL